ncbi:MAG: hypothetical protein ABI056_01260, partial [Caulobacteraceae bacterium]
IPTAAGADKGALTARTISMRTLSAGLAGLALALAATAASAQPASTAPTAPTGGKMTIDKTTVGDLLANPAAKAVLDKDLPGFSTDPRVEQAKGMTLKDVEP